MTREILHDLPFLPVEIPQGIKVCVENDLTQMSSYILLEQEEWFEDEMPFIRSYIQEGMHALDIGANHGVYGLTMAKALGGTGQVWAIEPASGPCSMIEAGIRENGLGDRITLLPIALSDHEGEAELNLGGSSELNTLQGGGGSGNSETIQLRTLDSLVEVIGDVGIDFIKLDAEGEEVNVLKGGQLFFEKHSPVVMFELKHGSQVNFNLLESFSKLGMSCYYLVPGLQALAPVLDTQKVDGYTLNLFAMRQDRAEEMAKRGMLFEPDPNLEPGMVSDYREVLSKRPYAEAFKDRWKKSIDDMDASWINYESSVKALLAFEDASLILSKRFQSGLFAKKKLQTLLQEDGVEARAILALVRVHYLLGERSQAVGLMNRHGQVFKSGNIEPYNKPFVLPESCQDCILVKENVGLWIEARVEEFLERRRAFSSFFTKDVNLLTQLIRNPERTIETDRRVALKFLTNDKRVKIRLDSWLTQQGQADHLNAWFWKEWAESGTVEKPKPKLYLVAGMHRSGSTWLYNAVRLLLKAWPETEGSVAGGWVNDWQRISQAKHVIVKTHGYQANLVSKADFVFYSYRDLRDAMASFRRKFGLADPLALALNSIQNDRALRRVASYTMRYEQMIVEKVPILREMAEVMGIQNLSDEDLQGIADTIDGMSYDSPGPKNDQFHLENLLHRGHITDGKHGSWEKDIPKAIIEEMERRHEGWMRENGYWND